MAFEKFEKGYNSSVDSNQPTCEYFVRKRPQLSCWIVLLFVLSSALWVCVLRQQFVLTNILQVLNNGPLSFEGKNQSQQFNKNQIRVQPVQEEIIILYWTKFFGHSELLGRGRTVLDEQRSCRYTMDRAEVNRSKLVIYNADDFNVTELLRYHPVNQLWAFAIWESPLWHSANAVKIFEKEQRNTFFNLSISYRLDSDFYEPYGSCRPLTSKELAASSFRAVGGGGRRIAAGKTKLAAWFVSNCNSSSGRQQYVANMSSYLQVDTYGKCGNLSCKENECTNVLNTTYKFYLSFENAICPDYVTEKVFKIFAPQINVIPVVLGGANYSRMLPPHSYLDVRDFATAKELTDYMKYLDKHDDEYEKYFAWRKTHTCRCYIGAGSDICGRAHELKHLQNRVLDVNTFWRPEDCQRVK